VCGHPTGSDPLVAGPSALWHQAGLAAIDSGHCNHTPYTPPTALHTVGVCGSRPRPSGSTSAATHADTRNTGGKGPCRCTLSGSLLRCSASAQAQVNQRCPAHPSLRTGIAGCGRVASPAAALPAPVPFPSAMLCCEPICALRPETFQALTRGRALAYCATSHASLTEARLGLICYLGQAKKSIRPP